MALVAQVFSKVKPYCSNCNASFDEGTFRCPDCGAVLIDGVPMKEDESVHLDLAKANLARMRGSLDEAQDVLLGTLRRFPSNLAAHQMLGEISYEAGRFSQAVEWFELALDLDPRNESVRRRLDDAKIRLASAQDKDVPKAPLNTQNARKWLGTGTIVLVCVVAAIAFLAGRQTDGKGIKNLQKMFIADKLEAPTKPADSEVEPLPTETVEPKTTPAQPDVAPQEVTVRRVGAQEDETLTQIVGQRSSRGTNLVSCLYDHRSHSITLTFAVNATEPGRRIGAELARAALDYSQECQLVVLRGIRNGSLSWIADAPRTNFETLTRDGWPAGESGTEWVNTLLTNEWFKNKATSSTEPAFGGSAQ